MIRVADLFCGAGGETTGIMQALGELGGRHDVAAVNHWEVAIETHKRNHPEARAYCMGLEQLNPLSVFGFRDRIDLLWASPECTHHSAARGGRPCSDQSRASAWLILKWLSELYVRHVILENVPEFLSWGPLGADGRPLESRKGETFRAFVGALKSMGYSVEWKLLCAADFGDPTTRTRLFLQAPRGRERISWPRPTHTETTGLFGYTPWRTAREIIDWDIPGEPIEGRAHPLVPATLRRIEAGRARFGANFLARYNGGEGRVHSLDAPLPVQDTSNRYALVRGETMRMLDPRELAAAQGFPSGYKFAGTRGDQVKQVGNSVAVGVARALAREALSA